MTYCYPCLSVITVLTIEKFPNSSQKMSDKTRLNLVCSMCREGGIKSVKFWGVKIGVKIFYTP